MTPEQFKAYKKAKRPHPKVKIYERRFIRKRYGRGGDCITCGKALNSRAKRCWSCWARLVAQRARRRSGDSERQEEKRRYMREYMRNWRAMPTQERLENQRLRLLNALRRRPTVATLCATNLCELYGKQPHRHCECGLPISPQANACQLCIAEQSRVEFKPWEEVA